MAIMPFVIFLVSLVVGPGSAMGLEEVRIAVENDLGATTFAVTSGGNVTANAFTVKDNAGDDKVVMTAEGEVGIGTASPGYPVDIQFDLANSPGGAGAMRVKNFRANGYTEFRAENSAGYSARLFKAGPSISPYKILTPNCTGFYNAVKGDVSILNDAAAGRMFLTAGAQTQASLAIDTNGNVGIGTGNTTMPTQKLEVNGGIRMNPAAARPACTASARGTFWFTQDSSNDQVEVCAMVNDVLQWKALW
ncbi:MAG: hypothetical protein C0631_04070 [Sedimenticola sp.]|nr:MAG: hypothetical protein C0631_04070 [Sedimenticola sp.]